MREGISERYERDILEPLSVYEREGRGRLMELCTLDVGGRQLPFVVFETGGEVVVTARHHICEFWGPTEVVMRLAESGQEGFTLIPVVDVEHYTEAELKKEKILQCKGGWQSAVMYDLFKGYKGFPPSNAKNDWPDYRYTREDSPFYIKAVKRLIDGCALFIDLHNCRANQQFFLTVSTGSGNEVGVFETLAAEMKKRNQAMKGDFSDLAVGRRLVPGVYQLRDTSLSTAINYAANLGKINLGFEIPVFDVQPVASGRWSRLREVADLAEVNAGVISGLVSFVNNSLRVNP